MATYYTLFASVQQLTQPVVSVPYVDAFGLGKELSLTKKSLLALMKRSLETSPTLSSGKWQPLQLLFESNVGFNRCPQYRKSNFDVPPKCCETGPTIYGRYLRED